MTIGERIRLIRKETGLNQTDFGEKVGLRQSSLGQIESGVRNATDRTIILICEKYGVREEWLRNGTGEMFLDFTEDEFSRAAATLSNDAFVRSLIVEYWKLDEDSRQLFRDFIHKLSDNMRGLE